MREMRHEQLEISVYHEQLANGLNVYVIPRVGFQQTYAMFSTQYGSIDREFIVPGDERSTVVPDGIAHFLEHKMFEQEDGEDVFNTFARYGASANAFTSFDMTAYLFSCTDNVSENLNTLLDFVQAPYFTEQTVEKEKGIIGQEIRMYDDDPGWRVYFNLLASMYEKHPINIDIAGTVETIAHITKDSLYTCYNTFYHPSNMNLVLVGDVDTEQMMALVRDNQAAKDFTRQPKIERIFPEESAQVARKRFEQHMTVSIPKVQFGYKDQSTGLSGRELLVNEYTTAVGLEAVIGKSSPLFNRLYEAVLIDKNFGWSYDVGLNFAHSIFGGDSKDPERLLHEIQQGFAEVLQNGIPEADFKRAQAKLIGRSVAELDSPRGICRNFCGYQFKDADYFDVLPVLEAITLEDVNQRLREHLVPDTLAVSLVLPK
ncbi:EF-P 5-aminopentanol modification-associated protein YfmH [Tumebacillus permanentifrigoris]|uniref:Putative Zn-dependent peptidase n=1 Tax=Tumebacillus permanentifrigoris TaxID=378543 RepID=A0A316D675_9BACL|nr:pitrilysin family protein [Tumebacillus permanentifrigoris]PWK10230.1 putative Zn-dependent peptidase [Tumebacillus permanentifrigoris]